MAVILDIIEVLKRKKADMINEALTAEFINLVDQLAFDYSIFESINGILAEHNKKTQEFQKSIEQAQRIVELHLVSSYADELIAFEKKIAEKDKELKKQEEALENQKKQISILEEDVRNSQIPADEINRDIAFIMGRSELLFTNTKFGYRITRNGKQAKNLSKGEENAIALIYFFNSLQDMNVNAANTIVVLDDPISSFDSNFYYNAISYIREKTLQVGQTFIFTHKFALLKDFSMLLCSVLLLQFLPVVSFAQETSVNEIPWGDSREEVVLLETERSTTYELGPNFVRLLLLEILCSCSSTITVNADIALFSSVSYK